MVLLRFFLSFLFLMSVESTVLADSVYWNYGIASVQVGFDKERNRPIGYKISFVGLGPDNASTKFEGCIKEATIVAGEETQRPLDEHILDATQVVAGMVAAKEAVTTEALKPRLKAETDKTATLIAHAEQVYRRSISNCMGQDEDAARSVQLGIVARMCVTWAPAGDPCKEARSPVGRIKDPATGRYAKIYDWLELTGALRPLNQIVQLVGQGGEIRDIAPDLRDRSYIPAPGAEAAQRAFEYGAERFRRMGMRYDYIAPRVAAIDKSVVVALIDAMDHPAFIFDKLEDKKRKLLSASNEVARTRLMECINFQGNPDIVAAAKCAGVTGETQSIEACLEGGRCIPELRAQANRAALTYTTSMSVKDLALKSQIPRILGAATFNQYKAAARTCAEITSNKQEFSYCVLRSQLKGADAVVLQCIKSNGPRDAARCVADNMPNSSSARAAKCFLDVQDDRARALCLASETVPEAAKAFQCYVDNTGDKRAALACIASQNLSPEARMAVSCATQSRSDYKAMGACLVSKNLSGDAQRLVSCYASGNGSWVGAGICLADGDLSAEQQVLLQCATQTGGEPLSFATCTGGLLAMKEFQQCQDNSFGEDDCFGENNEIRKFVRNVGLGDIDGNTVIGQIADVHLDAIKSTVSVAETIIGGVGRVAGDIAQGVAQVPGALAGFINDAGGKTCDLIGDLCPGKWPTINFSIKDSLDSNLLYRRADGGFGDGQIISKRMPPLTWTLKNQRLLVPSDPCSDNDTFLTKHNTSKFPGLQPCGDQSTSGSDDAPSISNAAKEEAPDSQDMMWLWKSLDSKDPSALGDMQGFARRAKAIYEASSDGSVQFGDKRVAIPIRLGELNADRLRSIGIGK